MLCAKERFAADIKKEVVGYDGGGKEEDGMPTPECVCHGVSAMGANIMRHYTQLSLQYFYFYSH